MRRPIAPIACILALLTGAWFGQAYTFFASADSISAADTDNTAAEAAVWRFYDAVDFLLRTGDSVALLAAVTSDFVDHADRPGLPPTRDGLIDYLASLRQSHPALHLAPLDLVAQGNRVVANLELAGDDAGSVLGLPLAGARPWPRVDLFRITDGRVAEHWGDPTSFGSATPLLSASLAVPVGPSLIPSLERVTYASAAPGRVLIRRGPAVILVETGAIEIQIEGDDVPVLLRPLPEPGFALSVSPSSEIEPTALANGAALVIPADVRFETRNPAAVAAVALILSLEAPTSAPAPGKPQAGPPPLAPGITIRSLAGGTIATVPPIPHTITIGRVTLGSSAQVASHETTGTEVLVVDAGTLTATLSGNPSGAWLRFPNQGATIAHPIEQIAAETGLTVSPGTTATYRNDTALPLSLLVVTLIPAYDAPPAGT